MCGTDEHFMEVSAVVCGPGQEDASIWGISLIL